jgi:hypothetical protein
MFEYHMFYVLYQFEPIYCLSFVFSKYFRSSHVVGKFRHTYIVFTVCILLSIIKGV